MKTLKAKAYAKINLFLNVTGIRDDGYHLLDTVMQSVSLFDEIEVTLTDGDDISIYCNIDGLSGSDNIVYDACKSFFEFSRWQSGLIIKINKNIPIAAGTGGGSADAATVLNILNRLSGKNYDSDILCKIALTLGADVPFCICGGTARAKGIGEELCPIKTPKLYLVMLKNGEKKSTKEMYRKIDSETLCATGDVDELIRGIETHNYELIYKNIYNAFTSCWDFESLTEIFKGFPYKSVLLSGSGPTVCALFEEKQDAILTANELKNRGYEAHFASFCETGSAFE